MLNYWVEKEGGRPSLAGWPVYGEGRRGCSADRKKGGISWKLSCRHDSSTDRNGDGGLSGKTGRRNGRCQTVCRQVYRIPVTWKPASITAAVRASSVTLAPASSVADLPARLTVTAVTPGTALRAFSTADEQWLQFMPWI